MQKINLYRYARSGGGTTISTIEPDVEYTIVYRLVSDEGKILVNGENKTYCIDVDIVEGWTEVDDENHTPENVIDAEILAKARAYDIIIGGAE